MRAVFTYATKVLEFIDNDGKTVAKYPANSHVRNELNKERRIGIAGEVECTVTLFRTVGKPYMPRPFPVGEWNITEKERRTDKWMQPLIFRTDAHQTVKVWETGPEGYVKETSATTEDYGYHIHFNNGSVHSDGCITTSLPLIEWMDKHVTFPCPLSVKEK